MPLVHAALERFADLLVAAPGRLLSAVLMQLVGRTIQGSQLAVIVLALSGVQPILAKAYLTQAVYLVGAAFGEFVPAQLGSTDAVFVLAAPTLGLTVTAAFAATLALHGVQLVVALVCGLGSAWLWWWEARRPTSAADRLEHAA
jgi:hypothetical protein